MAEKYLDIPKMLDAEGERPFPLSLWLFSQLHPAAKGLGLGTLGPDERRPGSWDLFWGAWGSLVAQGFYR